MVFGEGGWEDADEVLFGCGGGHDRGGEREVVIREGERGGGTAGVMPLVEGEGGRGAGSVSGPGGWGLGEERLHAVGVVLPSWEVLVWI